MICLRCGWCCKNISPLVTGNEDRKTPNWCPHLTYVGKMAKCEIYERRPKQCADECMGAGDGECCPIGLLALDNEEIDRPTNKCSYCGGLVFDHTMFCSDKCENKFRDEIE
jgi:hypothetical protein